MIAQFMETTFTRDQAIFLLVMNCGCFLVGYLIGKKDK